jgi:flagellar protein FliJ
MKGLGTLIKLKQRELDTLRRQLTEQQEQMDILLRAEQGLIEELERELALAAEQVEMAGFFGNFSKGIETRQQQVRDAMTKVQKKMDTLRDKISDAFGELKRFEVTLDNQQKRKKQKLDKAETQQLDEISLQQFQRKKKNGTE